MEKKILSGNPNIRVTDLGSEYEISLFEPLSVYGLNLNGYIIQNVAAGASYTDAVNFGQLQSFEQQFLMRLENLEAKLPKKLSLQPILNQGIRAVFDISSYEIISVVNCISWEVDYVKNQLTIHGFSSENTKIIGLEYKL